MVSICTARRVCKVLEIVILLLYYWSVYTSTLLTVFFLMYAWAVYMFSFQKGIKGFNRITLYGVEHWFCFPHVVHTTVVRVFIPNFHLITVIDWILTISKPPIRVQTDRDLSCFEAIWCNEILHESFCIKSTIRSPLYPWKTVRAWAKTSIKSHTDWWYGTKQNIRNVGKMDEIT